MPGRSPGVPDPGHRVRRIATGWACFRASLVSICWLPSKPGLLGFAAYLTAIAGVLVPSLRFSVGSDRDPRGLIISLQSAFIAALVSGLFDHYWANHAFPHAVALFWYLAALLVRATRLAADQGKRRTSGTMPLRSLLSHRSFYGLQLDLEYLELTMSGGCLDLDFVALLCVEKRAAHWGFHRDQPTAWVGFGRPHQGVVVLLAVAVANDEFGADTNSSVAGSFLHPRVGNSHLELGDAAL